jgi:hypothetical protein
MPYNPQYYVDYLERFGFQRAMTMWAFYVHTKYLAEDKLRRGVEIVRQRNPEVRVRKLDMSRYMEEAHTIMDIYNEAWSENWGHVPMTDHEFEHMAKDLKQIVDPDLVYILEKNDEPIAFSITVPNLNQALRHVRSGRLFPTGLPKLLAYSKMGAVYEVRMPLMGIRKAYHGKGFDSVLIMETVDAGRSKGYDACEMSWVLDVNKRLTNSLDALNGVRDKEYAMMEMKLA